MNYPAYPEYKDSGIEWLGEVPDHWVVQKLRRIASLTTGWTPPTGDDAAYVGDNPWANISDLGVRTLNEPQRCISDEAILSSRIPLSPRGSLLFSFKLSIGLVSFAGNDMYTNEAIATFRPSDLLDIGFAYYSFPITLVKNANENIYGAKLLNQGLMHSARIPLPPPDEQRTITCFLDRETAKIDALIAKQEQLIATLREDRIATITHAVTKGLDPNAEMKDSGVEWLGEIPAHWTVKPLKGFGDLVTGGTPPSGDVGFFTDDPDEGFPWFRPDDLDPSGAPSVATRFLSRTGVALLPRLTPPSVQVVSIGATLGKVGFVTCPSSSNQQITAVVCAKNPKFLFYALTAGYAPIWAASMGNTLPIINASRLGAVKFPTPTSAEQRSIVEYLDAHCAKLDALIAKSEQMIGVLREYRSALITDAVTGKIDVRGAA